MEEKKNRENISRVFIMGTGLPPRNIQFAKERETQQKTLQIL